jgi:PBP1b-binding outer membrane lipoprotein LpoB
MKKVVKMNGKKILVLILIGFLLFTTIFISGCVQQAQAGIKSQEEVGHTVTNMSISIGDLTSILEDIDKALG